ncbi:MAG: hypothetical protein WCG80_02885 [Spirochaetales bacterium]
MKVKTNKNLAGGRCIQCGKQVGSASRYMHGQGNICFSCLSREGNPCLLCFEDMSAEEGRKTVYDVLPAQAFKDSFLRATKVAGSSALTGRRDPVIEAVRRSYHLHEIRELSFEAGTCGYCGVPVVAGRNDVQALHGASLMNQFRANELARNVVGRSICADCYQNSFDKFRDQLTKSSFSLDSLRQSLVDEWDAILPKGLKRRFQAAETVIPPAPATSPADGSAPTAETPAPKPAPEAPPAKVAPQKSGDELKKLLDVMAGKSGFIQENELWRTLTEDSHFEIAVSPQEPPKHRWRLLRALWAALLSFFRKMIQKSEGESERPVDNTGNRLFVDLYASYVSYRQVDKSHQLHLSFKLDTPARFLYEAATVLIGTVCLAAWKRPNKYSILADLPAFNYDEPSLEPEFLLALAGRALVLSQASRVLTRYFKDDSRAYLHEIRRQYPVLGRLITYVSGTGEGEQSRVLDSLEPKNIQAWIRPQLEIWKMEDFKLVIQRTKEPRA